MEVPLSETIAEILKIQKKGHTSSPDEALLECVGLQRDEIKAMKLRIRGLSDEALGQQVTCRVNYKARDIVHWRTNKTFHKPAQKIGDPLSRERIRQILLKVARKLNHPSRQWARNKWRSKKLKKWLTEHNYRF